MQRVRFAEVKIGQYFETEYKEKCLKTDTVYIVTNSLSTNCRNMFNTTKNRLDVCNDSQWVWTA